MKLSEAVGETFHIFNEEVLNIMWENYFIWIKFAYRKRISGKKQKHCKSFPGFWHFHKTFTII